MHFILGGKDEGIDAPFIDDILSNMWHANYYVLLYEA